MTDHRHFEQLLAEFKRVGVDPDTFSAVLAVRPEDALRALRDLPDEAGPAAFLAQLRQLGVRPAAPADRATPADGSPSIPEAPHPARPERGIDRAPDGARGRTGT